MVKDQLITINDAGHKFQLAMLDGITDQKHLFAAGTLISRSDYEDVVTERTIAKLCGYPLCRSSPLSNVSRKGKYQISISEHIVYDLKGGLKIPTQAKQASHVGESGKGQTFVTYFEQTAILPSYCKDREMEKDIKNCMLDEMGLECSAIMSDGYSVEYSVAKQPPCSMKDPVSFHVEGLQMLDRKKALLGSSSEKLGKKIISVEFHADSCEDGGKILTAESYEGLKAHQDTCSSSKTVTRSCLKFSGPKKLSRSVTWADNGHGDLCEVRSNDSESGLYMASTRIEDVKSVSHLALAEACATALSHAAEAVSSGDLDAGKSIKTAKGGIVLLPSTHQLDEEVSEEQIEEDMTEEEATLLECPNKPGMPDFDIFDPDQSWFDGPPIGLSLTLSTFGMLWDSLFGWVSSSSLAYIYGKDESAYEEFLFVNGNEYPRRIMLVDRLSSEIKETISGCLARAGLPIAIYELGKGLGSLVETMSLTWAVPSFRVEQWQVIVFVLLDALSVCRIPRIAPYIFNKNKVLEGRGIGNEDYETMKDILLPLGRVPQFDTRCGG
ncbi:hypothetical protein Bca52824_093424 [Brassica carinata]|uniref:RNA polymerase II subunit B1 CTD phosphatase RPAP2 homolog n=1 Tax=Brassica carinata TaxID=52824 RepID=A0A8X7P681_BRACI|nr:hypothetical protein Bca52824_093424 [Brassica carinata]